MLTLRLPNGSTVVLVVVLTLSNFFWAMLCYVILRCVMIHLQKRDRPTTRRIGYFYVSWIHSATDKVGPRSFCSAIHSRFEAYLLCSMEVDSSTDSSSWIHRESPFQIRRSCIHPLDWQQRLRRLRATEWRWWMWPKWYTSSWKSLSVRSTEPLSVRSTTPFH